MEMSATCLVRFFPARSRAPRESNRTPFNAPRHALFFNQKLSDLFAAPGAMKSQLLTWVEHAQNDDGSFYCIIMSAAGDQQYGRGDPCANAPPHPDDISMVMIAAYEQLIFRNDSALVAQVYPALLKAFGYYTAVFNATPWALPFRVHETYDAVAESASITGEGNLGTSLFNALEYVTGLLCMAGLADSPGDAATAGAAWRGEKSASRGARRGAPEGPLREGEPHDAPLPLLLFPPGGARRGSTIPAPTPAITRNVPASARLSSATKASSGWRAGSTVSGSASCVKAP